jgi:hypothetical protein
VYAIIIARSLSVILCSFSKTNAIALNSNIPKFIDPSNVTVKSAGTQWTATYDCYFEAMSISSNNQHYVAINDVRIDKQDGMNNMYITVASGFLKKGDKIYSGCPYTVYGLKS